MTATEFWYIHKGMWDNTTVRPLAFVREYGNRGKEYLTFRRDDRRNTNIIVEKADPIHTDYGRLYPTREEALAAAKKMLEENIEFFRKRIAATEKELQNLK